MKRHGVNISNVGKSGDAEKIIYLIALVISLRNDGILASLSNLVIP